MKIHELDGFAVTGFLARTTNEDEATPARAKISNLWAKFNTNAAPHLTGQSRIFGLYTNYESDFTGAFDVIACSDTLSPKMISELIHIEVRSGKYLIFSSNGEMPQAVIKLWREVWHYFDSPNCPYQRAYTTDFEYYKNDNEVDIYIAVK